ncbi:TetR/AcrR family transcriptional regulator [Phenylobacterium soli]|uniref:TetR/AcrR family transcriptional regulator n=1 Tax=Phenylobacterium soli TaxID=2170551 RepID=UPI00221E37C8|nr:TetR/AcrR family transcriptional regulator [Phenylobacterium soli]
MAEDVFVSEGFAAASMSEIAARLGGSKGTLYNYFKSKEELFEAYVLRRCILNMDGIYALPGGGEGVAETLTRIGRAYLRRVLSDENLRHFRLIIAEAERYPEIGKAFYEAGPGRGSERLADEIRAWVKAGLLEVDDPQMAAFHFTGLCQNRYMKARLCNYVPELSDAEIEAEVAAAVKTFLRAYGPRG